MRPDVGVERRPRNGSVAAALGRPRRTICYAAASLEPHTKDDDWNNARDN
jgi:hypothetical protein